MAIPHVSQEMQVPEADEMGAVAAGTEKSEREAAGRQMPRGFDEALKRLKGKQADEIAFAE
jgi:hypothetical protein